MKKNTFVLKKNAFSILLTAVLSVSSLSTFATTYTISTAPYFHKDLPSPQFQNAMGTFMVDMTKNELRVVNFENHLNEYFGLSSQHTFQLTNKQFDTKTGYYHYSYQHLYNDIIVNGDMVFVHAKGDLVHYVNGQIVNFKDLSLQKTLTEEEVNTIVLKDFGVDTKAYVNEISNLIYKQQTEEQSINLRYVSKVSLTSLSPIKSIEYLIDTQTREIVSKIDKLHKADASSNSATYFRGNKNMTVDSYNGMYRLKDNARNIRTLNAVNLDGNLDQDGTFSGYTEYLNNTANFTTTATKPAVEVHWAMKETYDYYKNVHNRTSFDGNGHAINNYYDAGSILGDDENAAALDEVYRGRELIGMFYGKGGSYLHPVVTLDVAGHEYSHMVVSRNGNGGLDYQNESGALNESFADIFGTAIEFYVNENPNWTMGEGLIKSNNIRPNYFRNLADPNSAPTAIGMPQQPDTYLGKHWQYITNNPNPYNDYGGVHINSGVGNHWFYLLSEGGSGMNDLGKYFNVNGISIQKAEQIAYKALITGLSKSATYYDAYNATAAAAAILYGANSPEWIEVVNAWYAVGVVNVPASTKNFEFKSKLNIYPNPVSGNEVFIDSSLEEATTVEMFDMTGKQVLAPKTLDYKTTINVSAYKTGMYILKFKSNSGEYAHKLMIK